MAIATVGQTSWYNQGKCESCRTVALLQRGGSKEAIGMRAQRKFFDVVVRELESHKPGFRDSGKTCTDCGKAVPLKYRGDQENPKSFELGRWNDCYVKTAEGFFLRYNYSPWYENASVAGFYCIFIALFVRFYWDLPRFSCRLSLSPCLCRERSWSTGSPAGPRRPNSRRSAT